jgi:hypothetical protein
MDKPIAWYDPSNGMVSTDQDCPLFTPLGQVWGLYVKEEASASPKDAALRLALEALYGFIPYLPLEHDKPQCDRYDQAITAIKAALEAKDEPVQVSPLQFVEMVMEKEHLVGKPIFWAEWPNKGQA